MFARTDTRSGGGCRVQQGRLWQWRCPGQAVPSQALSCAASCVFVAGCAVWRGCRCGEHHAALQYTAGPGSTLRVAFSCAVQLAVVAVCDVVVCSLYCWPGWLPLPDGVSPASHQQHVRIAVLLPAAHSRPVNAENARIHVHCNTARVGRTTLPCKGSASVRHVVFYCSSCRRPGLTASLLQGAEGLMLHA